MNLYRYFRDQVVAAVEDLAAAGDIPAGLDCSRVAVEPTREAAHGDITTNAAMVLAKAAGSNPRALAARLAERLRELDAVGEAEIAGPGFINMRLAAPFWHARLKDVLLTGPAYGDSQAGGGRAINVEYVSANPTGPLHVAHARGAVVGDALASLLEKAGFDVTREYYVNDSGGQVEALARSVHLRYREALGERIGEIPDGLYPGDYLKPVADALARRDGDKWKDADEKEWLPEIRAFATAEIMAGVRDDLAALGITFDLYVAESS
ncbi:MAG TPA: arginine--tRNA ligase, partial [Rhodospirillales bacterium]